MMCLERMATSEHLISKLPWGEHVPGPLLYVLIYELPPSLLSMTAPTGPASCLQKTTAEVNLYFHPELNGGRGGGRERGGRREGEEGGKERKESEGGGEEMKSGQVVQVKVLQVVGEDILALFLHALILTRKLYMSTLWGSSITYVRRHGKRDLGSSKVN